MFTEDDWIRIFHNYWFTLFCIIYNQSQNNNNHITITNSYWKGFCIMLSSFLQFFAVVLYPHLLTICWSHRSRFLLLVLI